MEDLARPYPDALDPRLHRDREGTAWRVWVRRALLCVLAAISAAALANVFGQQTHTTRTSGGAATVAVQMPSAVPGGLIFQERVTIVAHRQLPSLRLVMDPSFYDAMTLNTMTPGASQESSRGGRPVYQYGTLPAGKTFVIWFQWQVNPTNVGRHGATLEVS